MQSEQKSLLHSQLHYLPMKCNFVGCFVNNSKIERYTLRKVVDSKEKTRNSDDIELGIISRFPFINMIYRFMDSKINRYLSERSVALMLEVHGFKIMDITEFNGLTYFHSQKLGHIYN